MVTCTGTAIITTIEQAGRKTMYVARGRCVRSAAPKTAQQ